MTKIKVNRNVVFSILLLSAITFSVVQIIQAVDPDPGHTWAEIDDVALGVSQGGTGLTTLTLNNVLLGNGTGNVLFVAPGTSGNVLTSNGTTWQSTTPTAGAPTNATYITQTANGTLSAEQALASLATGPLKNTTVTGVLTVGSISLTSEVTGILPTTNGGTGANLSSTGGAYQFVRQNSAGAVFTVGAIIDADVPDSITITTAGTAGALTTDPTACGAGTYVNDMAANGTLACSAPSAPSGTTVLLYNDEVNGSLVGSSAAVTSLKSWPINVDPSIYSKYILEAEVTAMELRQANGIGTNFNWFFNVGGALKRQLNWRLTQQNSLAAAGRGYVQTATIKTIITNSGLSVGSNLQLNGLMSTANAATYMQAQSFRVYGVK